MERCNGKQNRAKDKQRRGKLIKGGIEEEIEKKRQTDRKREGDIGSEPVGCGGGVSGRGERR